jgi:hypothetical protein
MLQAAKVCFNSLNIFSVSLLRTDFHGDARKTLPDKFEDVAEKSVLTAFFWLARLHSKKITSDRGQTIHNLEESYVCGGRGIN